MNAERKSLIQPRRTYSHYHACDGELRLDCEACIEEWIADIEAGGATRESAVATVDRAIQEGGRVWWCS